MNIKNIFMGILFTITVISLRCIKVNTPADDTSPPELQLEQRHPLPTVNDLADVIWTGKLFVAVGDYGDIVISSDGVEWKLCSIPKGGDYKAIAFSGNRIVAVGTMGEIVYSDDGQTWNRKTFPSFNTFYDIIWAQTQFVAIGVKNEIGGTKILTSSDGITWEQHDIPVKHDLHSIAWSGKQFIALGFNAMLTSADGHTWHSVDLPQVLSSAIPQDIISDGESFIIIAAAKTINRYLMIAQSNDELSWQVKEFKDHYFPYRICYSDSVYTILFDRKSVILTSRDKIDWTLYSTGAEMRLNGLISNGREIVVVGSKGTILTSQDFVNWKTRSFCLNHYNSLLDVVWSGQQLVAVGDKATVLTSPDGITWTKKETDLASQCKIFSIAHDGKEFFALASILGPPNTLLRSVDCTHWQMLDLDTSSQLYLKKIYYDGSSLFCVGSLGMDGAIFKSSNGTDWTKVVVKDTGEVVNPIALRDIIRTPTQVIAVGDYYTTITSIDCVQWSQREVFISGVKNICWTGSKAVVVGVEGSGFSVDGSSWDIVTTGAIGHVSTIHWTGRHFIASRNDELIFRSTDAITWKQQRSIGKESPIFSSTNCGNRVIFVGDYGLIATAPEEAYSTIR